ncbi:uncharacterized protein DDB_G0284459 isoform X2 [Vespula pensylvanica]|uniref:uncharacterized protein DDB_G0284459 isoform X2 n=1 Tax=Vespula pensylvanica TaxID=30213 RepID=UPI001CB9FA0E|nr:uncharacterized protein DDB_G0284459 isoform X2 [Vespula pensylvanica]
MENRKSKKRTSKKNNMFDNWANDGQYAQSNNAMSNMEYPQVLWQPGIQSHIPNHNGQRLFAAMSDPSVCGYSPMPMTYTMEPVSLPTMYRLYQPMPYGVHNVHGRLKQKFYPKPPVIPNGYTSLQENKTNSTVLSSYQNGDYASLPPVANKSNGINEDEISSEHRRYSDPGLGPTEPPVHNQGDDSDSADSGSSITTIGRSNKLVLSLIEQMAELKKSNGQLFKELSEAKFELETMKLKFSQYKHSSDYQPGMLSDLIREIREANKMCEEGLVIKVQSMVEEKHNQRLTEIDILKGQMSKLIKEKEETERRVSKLEKEVAALKSSVKLEKLMDSLRKKAKVTINDDGDEEERVSSSANRRSTCPSFDVASLGKRCRPSKKASPSSSSSSSSASSSSSSSASASSRLENEPETEEDEEIDLDNDEDVTSKSQKDITNRSDSKLTTIHDNCMNLSGPVTDL